MGKVRFFQNEKHLVHKERVFLHEQNNSEMDVNLNTSFGVKIPFPHMHRMEAADHIFITGVPKIYNRSLGLEESLGRRLRQGKRVYSSCLDCERFWALQHQYAQPGNPFDIEGLGSDRFQEQKEKNIFTISCHQYVVR